MLHRDRLLIGSHGDILDIAFIPQHKIHSETDNTENEMVENTENNKFLVALITNSTQVRLMDETFNCRVLEGHTDIVLSVDVSPDG